ncbi:MAG: aspartyl protease family protein [Janthinobacterium lividum]
MIDRRGMIALGAGGLAMLALPGRGRAAAGAPGRGPIVSRIVLEDGRLWIGASIAGSKPYLFVIDTGSGFSFLRPEVARELKLPVTGGHRVGGLGKKTEIDASYIAHDVLFGGHLRQLVVAFAGYHFQRGMPADAAGLLAAGLFTTHDSDLDFEAGEWRYWPDGRPDRDGFVQLDGDVGGPVSASLSSHRLTVRAYLDGLPYRLMLDTGSPGTVTLFPRVAKRSGLFADGVPFAPLQTAGFGGTAAKLSRSVRAKTLAFGPVTIDRPIVTVMDPGQHSDLEHDGLIGLPLIALLTLSIDVRGRRIWARRNARPVVRGGYRLAGLWLDRDASGAARVTVVGVGSPAAAAGVRVGDVVADPPTFEEAVRRIGGAPGRAVTLGLRREGARVDVAYTLRDYL